MSSLVLTKCSFLTDIVQPIKAFNYDICIDHRSALCNCIDLDFAAVEFGLHSLIRTLLTSSTAGIVSGASLDVPGHVFIPLKQCVSIAYFHKVQWFI